MDPAPGAPQATVRLAFPPEARLLGTVRLVVGIAARKAGMGAEGIEDLKVAVSETCAVAVGDLTRAGRATARRPRPQAPTACVRRSRRRDGAR